MNCETFEEQKVTYTLELNGKFYIIENVPARPAKPGGHAPQLVMLFQQQHPMPGTAQRVGAG